MLTLYSWNVNGIRACAKKTFFEWLNFSKADIICLQETKAHPDQLDKELLNPKSYQTAWDSAEKKGYSGVATFSQHKPQKLLNGIGIKKFDCEGRTLIHEFPQFVLINCYFPNGQRDHKRVPFKMNYCQEITHLCEDYRHNGKEVIICGDFNTAHEEIDLKNPKQNQNTTGFLTIERQWVSDFIKLGYQDIFRQMNPQPDHYTWWSYRKEVRERNIGWRIDYFFVSPGLKKRVKKAFHQPHIMGSDHCPIGIDVDLPKP